MNRPARHAPGALASLPAVLGWGAAALLASASAAAPTPTPAPAPAPAGDRLKWVETFEEAQALAKKEKKLVLVDFYTDWCGWCKRLDKDVFADEGFQKQAAGVIGVKVNAEKHRALAEKFGARSFPRLFFLDSKGATLENVRGYLNLADFTARVKAIKAGDTEYARHREAASDPADLGAIQRFARFLSETSQHDAAIPYWQQVHDAALQQMFASPQAGPASNLHRESLFELGRAYQSVGLVDVARQHFSEVATMYSATPHAAQSLLALADLEAKAGRKPAAQAALERLMKEHPGRPETREAAARLAQLQAAPK